MKWSKNKKKFSGKNKKKLRKKENVIYHNFGEVQLRKKIWYEMNIFKVKRTKINNLSFYIKQS